MKITIYELLTRIKEQKNLPKKIKYCGKIYEYEDGYYLTSKPNCKMKVMLGGTKDAINMFVSAFNENVEIIEEETIEDMIDESLFEDKEIEKLSDYTDIDEKTGLVYGWSFQEKKLKNKINELIDELKKLKVSK